MSAGACLNFADLKKGQKAVVRVVCGISCLCQRIQEMGLVPGTEFCVEKVAPFGDPVEISFRGQRVCLRKFETNGIEVELLD